MPENMEPAPSIPPNPRALQTILASPCHRAPLREDDRWNSFHPNLHCTICGSEFHARGNVYDFRLPSHDLRDALSFEAQWRRRRSGDFERQTLYGADADAELATMMDAFGIGPHQVAGSWILDAGCGIGRLGKNLARLGANVVSLDLADALGLMANGDRSSNLHFLQADLMNPPLRGGAFDYVWSAGVIHHTAAPRDAFNQLATLVRPGGKLAIWLYSADRFSPFLAMRRVLPFARRMPEPAAAALCRCLALPLYAASLVAPVLRRRRLPLATIRFGLYDSLTPRYQSRHTEHEVCKWFSENGFVHIRKWSELGLCGERGG
jgi:SAM-dependent methyltransferase